MNRPSMWISWLCRSVVVIVLALGILWLRPGLAHAHANLVRSDPPANAILDSSPAQVQLWFSEPPELRFLELNLLDRSGQMVAALGPVNPSATDPLQVTASLQPLSPGIYTVTWRAVSAVDGHATAGAFAFVVGRGQVPATGLLSTPAANASTSPGPTLAGVLIRWLGYLAVALIVGIFAFGLLVLRPTTGAILQLPGSEAVGFDPDRLYRILSWCVFAGIILALITTVIGSLVQAAANAQVGLLTAITGPWITLLGGTRYGLIFGLRLVLLLLLLVLWYTQRPGASPLTPQPPLPPRVEAETGLLASSPLPSVGEGSGVRGFQLRWWAGLGMSMLLLLTTSLLSHAAAQTDALPAIAADWLHLFGMSLWAGGLLSLSVVLRVLSRQQASGSARWLALLLIDFTRVAIVAVAVLVLTGLYRGVNELGDWANLVDTRYGWSLVLKVGLLLLALSLAGVNLLIVEPRVRRLSTTPDALAQARPWYRRVRWTVAGELMLISAILAATGVLTMLPPGREAFGSGGSTIYSQAGGLRLILHISPDEPGLNTFDLYVHDAWGRPVGGAQKVALIFSSADMDMGQTEVALQDVDQGHYAAQGGYISMAGLWRVETLVRLPGQEDVRTTLEFRPRPVGQVGASDAVMALTSTPPGNAPDLTAGRALYEDKCLSCHGIRGRGNGPLAASLTPRPADLKQHVPAHRDDYLLEVIRNGIVGSSMPAFKDQLSAEQQQQVLEYIRALAGS